MSTLFYCLSDIVFRKISVEEKQGHLVDQGKGGRFDLDDWLTFVSPEGQEEFLSATNQLDQPDLDNSNLTYRIKAKTRELLEVSDNLKLGPRRSSKERLLLWFIYLKEMVLPSEKIQQALYEVARLCVETEKLNELLKHLHNTIKSLIFI